MEPNHKIHAEMLDNMAKLWRGKLNGRQMVFKRYDVGNSGENQVASRTTEQLHPQAIGFDALPLEQAAVILAEGQAEAARTPRTAAQAISTGAQAMANTIRTGGVLRYAAAGSSGLMAAADALELGGTYSIPPTQIRIHMAGGQPTGVEMPGDTEDDAASLAREMNDIASHDTLIAVSASGSTPFTIAAAKIAREAGAQVIGIANNLDTELSELSHHSVVLETPPEVIAGSTRMGAGTAQKIALNMLSTLMAVQLGHVHDGMMVNLKADNIKLRQRANAIVAHAAGATEDQAASALESAGGDVKTAILLAAGAENASQAKSLLAESDGHLRPALSELT